MNTNNTTLENNILIAEFMGKRVRNNYLEKYVKDSENKKFPNGDRINGWQIEAHESKIKYHYSWDWLMESVHKCLEICHDKMLNEWEQGFTNAFLSMDIVQMYDETVEFIKWYNENAAKKD